MKIFKYLNIGILKYAALALLVAPAGFAFARAQKVATTYGSVTIQTLGVEEPAILASNPFYGLTDLMRGVKDSFASSQLDKITVKSDNLDLKAAQLLKLRTVAPENTKSAAKALNEYQLALYQYTIVAARITADDLMTPDGAALVPELIKTSLVHLRFIDDQLASSQTTADQALLMELFDRLSRITVRLFVGDIGLETVRLTVLGAQSDDLLITARSAEMIAMIAKQAATLDQTAAAQELMAIRVSILDDMAQKIIVATKESDLPAIATMSVRSAPTINNLSTEQLANLTNLAGSAAERIQTISYLLSTEELAQDTDLIALRNQLLIKVFSK